MKPEEEGAAGAVELEYPGPGEASGSATGAAAAIPAPIRIHIGNEGAGLVPAPLLVATDLQEPRR